MPCFTMAALSWARAWPLIYPLLTPLVGTLLAVGMAFFLTSLLTGGAHPQQQWSMKQRYWRTAASQQSMGDNDDEVSHAPTPSSARATTSESIVMLTIKKWHLSVPR